MKKINKVITRIFTIFRQRPRLRAAVYFGGLTTIVAGCILGLYALNTPLEVATSSSLQRVDLPVEITISRRIDAIELDAVKIVPIVKGAWKHETGSFTQDDRVVFHPDDPLVVDTKYTVTLPQLSLKYGGELQPGPIVFTTEHAPGLSEAVGLSALADGATIAADYDPMVALTSKNRMLRELELRTKTELRTELVVAKDKEYTWQTEGYLPQGESVVFEVYDRKNQTTLLKRTLIVAPEPAVQTAVKATNFTKGDQAVLEFSQPIEPASQKYIEFSLAGAGVWRDTKTYVFTPETIEPGKTYSYVIKEGLRSMEGGIITKDQPMQFQTVGAVSASASPYGSELSQAKQTIRFVFDQAVDRKSAEQRFTLSSGKVVGTSWSANTFIVEATELGYQRTVTATIGAGVVNGGFGLPSARAFSAQFTTEVRSNKLKVPFYAQQQASTCTAAALRMALGFRGVGAGEMELVYKMGYSPRDMNRDASPHEWDDPDEMFVGYASGGTIFTGAGPDAGPVAKAAIASGRSASAVRGINAGWIAEQVHAGNPVIMFGATSNTGFETWVTPGGKTVRMNITSHVTVVTGVKGEPSSPVGFWVNDPLRGSSYWSAGQVQANINRDAYAQAVVVY